MLPEVNIIVYPSNCSSNEIGKHKCNERKAEIKVLLGRYIDKTKGRVYQGDGNPELEEKNIVNLVKRTKTTPLKCEDKDEKNKNIKNSTSEKTIPVNPVKPSGANTGSNMVVAPAAG